ncbi:MAG: HEAT repeat domain-containing protein [Desulfobacteraceae bacterium]|jgi:hypothetical protein
MQKKPANPKADNPVRSSDDAGLLNQAIVNLHIARRTLRIYPITHEQVKRSVVRAFKSLVKIMGTQSRITLAVMKESFVVGDQVLDAKNSALMDLARVLKHYEIATVTIRKGLEIKELVRFLQLICADREKIMAKGGIVAVARERKLPSIQIQAVDYSKLQLTEEDEIHRSPGDDSLKVSVWQQFVSNLMKAKSIQLDADNPRIHPSRLAELLNYKVLDAQQVIDHYLKAMAITMSSAGPDTKTSTDELQNFRQMIEALNSDLKQQFLSTTFKQHGQVANASDAAHLIDGLGADLIIQMLRQAGSEGKKISPSLVAFIKKMGHSIAPIPAESQAHEGNETGGLTSEKVESLLSHEQYDTYVDSDYREMLDNLTRDARQADKDSAGRTLMEEVEADLSGAGIHAHVGRAITRLMDQCQDISAYRDWARQLNYLLDDLVENRAYRSLTGVIEYVRREKRSKDNERAEIAGLVSARFNDPQFVAKAIESVPTYQGDADPDALVFFTELGEPVVVEIFDGLDPRESFNEEGVLNQILGNLKSLTTKEALQRLKDPRPDYVRHMIRIIRKVGDSESVLQMKSLMDHPEKRVRMEALAALLSFDNKWGLMRLRELLGDPGGADFAEAAELAGRHRVPSVVPLLESIARQRGDIAHREAALRVLGRIGDPGVLPTLNKLARRRRIIVGKQNQRLKRVVFDTLGGYPRDAVQDLIRYGIKQKDNEIQSACKRLLRTGGKTERREEK